MSAAETAADLRAAADLLERDGWIQGDYGDPTCGYCALGALAMVATNGQTADPLATHGEPFKRHLAAFDALWDAVSSQYDGVDGWNDAVGRTAAEVISAFRTTADRIEARQ